MIKRPRIIIFFLIIFLAAFLRLYKVTAVPPHLYWDEASIAYNAYALNLTGKDEWGVDFPLLFKSFGDYKLPLYIYLTTVSQKIFGFSDFSVRAPSVFAGIGMVIIMSFFVKELTLPSTALLATFFLAISPWALQFSRAGFEANVALFCCVFGTLLFLISMRIKNFLLLFPSLLFFAASVYTYHSAVVTTPLVLVMLVVVFFKELKRNLQKTIPAFVFLLLIILPFINFYVLSPNGRTRATQESFLKMPGSPVTNFINNYVANFSLDYLFFHGDQDGRHSVKKLGELYLWQLPTILVGAYFLLRYRSKASVIVFSWILIGSLPPALTLVSPHALRGLLAVFAWQILSAIGAVYIFINIKKYRYLSIPIVCFAMLLYLKLYYFNYPKAYALDWSDGQRQTVYYLKTIEKDYDKIYYYKDLDLVYIRLYWPIPPNSQTLGKFVYFDYATRPINNDSGKKSLVVAPKWFFEDSWKFLTSIKNAAGDIMFNIYDF